MAIRLSGDGTEGPQEFRPAGPEALIYICGITPYDASHLGHVATFLSYDVLVRRLAELGHKARVVRNITDLDDPILPRARQLGVPYEELADSEVAQFHQDMAGLGMLQPAAEPRVSTMVEQVIEFIEALDAAGYSYRLDGTVYFDVSRSATFGRLSGYSEDLMLHLSRERGGDPDNLKKRNRLDFILWRPSLEGEPSFDSPFGRGIPGWHIGCSAMARDLLGATVDLHGGGVDLVFPHHESELAQTMALQQEPFARHWHHCEFVSYRGTKMSKSLGNIVLARDLLRRHDWRAIRLAVLRQYRYRGGFEWRDHDIVLGERLLGLLLEAVRRPSGPDPRPWAERVRAAIDDDLDFPTAVAELENLARGMLTAGEDPTAPAELAELAGLLGVDLGRGSAG